MLGWYPNYQPLRHIRTVGRELLPVDYKYDTRALVSIKFDFDSYRINYVEKEKNKKK